MKPLEILIPLFVFMFPPSLAFAAQLPPCPACTEWNKPHVPFRIHGNIYYVGMEGLSSVLVTSDEGHVLIDGGSAESAPLIVANIEALGFRVENVKLILNSHAHFDHVGGIAELQRLSGATVVAGAWSAQAMRLGGSPIGDPQYLLGMTFVPIQSVTLINDEDTLTIGSVRMTAHFTPGHTPGGTSWSWRSCEDEDCADIVYADSVTAVSADDFYFTRTTDYPTAVEDFAVSFAKLEALPCDILLSPHPGFTDLFEAESQVQADSGSNPFVDSDACRNYAGTMREMFDRRIARENAQRSQ
jgi:metallo-beta-lactamase class B